MNKIRHLLCKLGIHTKYFLTCDVAGPSRCTCGKKNNPAITWPRSSMKVFSIVENFPADGGHKISVVKGASDKQALELYKEATHRCSLPSWIKAVEITEPVTEIYRYDNPNYEG